MKSIVINSPCPIREQKLSTALVHLRITKLLKGIANNLVWLVMTFAMFFMMSAATQAATTTTIVPTGMTVPINGFVAAGSGFRHLWVSDHLQGLCRVDPHLDSGAAPGTYALNPNTCTLGGPVVYDPANNNVYIADDVANRNQNQGLVRTRFLPGADGGHGLIDTAVTRLGDASSCGITSNRPTAIAQGPNGHLYLTFQRNGNIVRVVNPTATNVPCGSFQTVATQSNRNFGLAWVGRNLYGLDGASPWVINNADICTSGCAATTVFVDAALLPGGLASDQVGASPNGSNLYIADITSVTRIKFTNGVAGAPELNWATGMSNPSSISVDKLNAANPVVYVGDDPTGGNGQLQGRVFRVSEAVATAAPGAPSNVVAIAGDASASVNWNAGTPGSTVTTSYTVGYAGSNGSSGSQTVNGSPPATSTVVNNLANGVTYTFSVVALNSVGSSPAATSNSVTPQVAIPPTPPQNVSAIPALSGQVALAWNAPASNGGSPITSYSISYDNGGTAVTAGNATGILISNLINGTLYSFTVSAVNSAGASTGVTVTATPVGPPPQTDIALGMSGPADVPAGSDATYTLTVTNTGTLNVAQVTLTDVVPTVGASYVIGSATASQGICFGSPITCNLGGLNVGASATVNVTLNNVTATITNSASVVARDGSGAAISDANPGDNSASVTTTLTPPPGNTTDLRLSGSGNGGGTINSAVTFTWQIRNTGAQAATTTVLSHVLPPSFRFNSANIPGGTCSGVTPGSLGGTVNCTLASLAPGQTVNVTVSATATQAGTFPNTGQASFSGTDTNPANNLSTVTIRVR
jgi:uncharacterized repeat protein (TIGR01451 family)